MLESNPLKSKLSVGGLAVTHTGILYTVYCEWEGFAGLEGGNTPIHMSGGRLCTLIGVPWQHGAICLKQYICEGAESAEHAETAGYTYEGTPTTA